ncbi:MAG TPA: potassium-transporting ATPase subunit KdpA [Thermodesulfobacteriota bacterium]|nr:potassium-transporting ATPase subunit KdpA [Thermodesulfobacteriota bacterium]
MNGYDWLQLVFYFAVLLGLAKPLGAYMARVYEGERTFLHPVLGPIERVIYKAGGINAHAEMTWKQYAWALLIFNFIGIAVVYALQRLQGWLPLNPMGFGAVSADSSFNTAVSFGTNTNWQGYAGETTMSDLTQMLGLTVQNFLSAASGMAVLIALIRGFSRALAKGIGNFWVDMVRGTLYILLPLSLVVALILVSQGVVQNFHSYRPVPLLEAATFEKPKLDEAGQALKDAQGKTIMEKADVKEQLLPMGPAASQIAIKQLGTNGGGFFNVNSAHPFENATPLSNFVEMLSILLIPGALCYTFGRLVRDTRQGWAILAAMTIAFALLLSFTVWSEQSSNPALGSIFKADPAVPGNYEGKEVRFGIVNSAIWATATTCASNGSVNSMHDSYMPLGGMFPMWLMQLGEVIFGGVGSGLYGMLAFAVIAVFVAGLMVGRTPEYLGKKIEAYEMKMSSLVILIPVMAVLVGTAVAVLLRQGTSSVLNPGPHGFSEILYAFSSASNNNGSAFAGLNASTPFYNTALGIAMLCGRYLLKVPILAIAGALAAKKKVPVSSGTLETHTPLFVGWLLAVVVMVGALSFLPALALGPIVEHMLLH